MEDSEQQSVRKLVEGALGLMVRESDPDRLRNVAALPAVQAMSREDQERAMLRALIVSRTAGDVQSFNDPTLDVLNRLFIHRCKELGADAAVLVYEDFNVSTFAFTQGLNRYALGSTTPAQDLDVLGKFRELAQAQDAACIGLGAAGPAAGP